MKMGCDHCVDLVRANAQSLKGVKQPLPARATRPAAAALAELGADAVSARPMTWPLISSYHADKAHSINLLGRQGSCFSPTGSWASPPTQANICFIVPDIKRWSSKVAQCMAPNMLRAWRSRRYGPRGSPKDYSGLAAACSDLDLGSFPAGGLRLPRTELAPARRRDPLLAGHDPAVRVARPTSFGSTAGAIGRGQAQGRVTCQETSRSSAACEARKGRVHLRRLRLASTRRRWRKHR